MSAFVGRTCVVLGGSDGIGAAVARTFAAYGASVVIGARGEARGAAAASALRRETGARVEFVAADVTDEESMAAFARAVGERFAGVDALVVSGGTGERAHAPQRFLDAPLEVFAEWARAQWFSRLLSLRACLPLLTAGDAPRKKAVFLTTDAGRVPTPFEAAPGGAAAALILSLKVIARELAPLGVCLNAVSTTVTSDTPGLSKSLDSEGRRVFERALERQPFPVRAQDVADAVAFFAGPHSDAITGQTLSVNGGLSYPG